MTRSVAASSWWKTIKLPRVPEWLPFLGPVLAAVAGGLAGDLWLGGDFRGVLATALVCGFAPILAYRLWKWRQGRQKL